MEEGARRRAELLTRLQRALGQGPSLDLAVLFGSAAIGTSRPDSDLDAAVLPASGLDAAEEAASATASHWPAARMWT